MRPHKKKKINTFTAVNELCIKSSCRTLDTYSIFFWGGTTESLLLTFQPIHSVAFFRCKDKFYFYTSMVRMNEMYPLIIM